MELLWLRIHALGSLMLAEVLWTLPIDQDQWPRPQDVELAEGYLTRFYSLNPGGRVSGRRIRSTSAMEDKTREMQNFFGLRETGRLDLHTLDVMRQPRCGVPDVENFSFYPEKPKWKNHTITYTIAKYTPDMKREDVEKSFRSALKMWSDAAPLMFIKVNHGKADIVFSFARRSHGDFFPFDGPRGVLAHAFQPGDGIGGDVHFDEDETWTAGRQGYSLFAVAAHELGHSLGLTHSKDPAAIMYPNYRYHSGTQHSLSKDDLLGIQTLYGEEHKETQAAPIKCDPFFSFDAAVMIRNEIVFFKNRYMWMRTTQTTYWNRLRESHSSTYLPSISSHVDAAYDIPAKGVAYIFTGHKYWVVQQLKMKSRAGSIHEYGFSSRVRQVDAAVHVSEYGKTVFFTGEVYYRYDESKRRMDPGFPRLIQTDWPGIPRRVDAAFKLDGNIFLFSGTKSYQYDFRQKRLLGCLALCHAAPTIAPTVSPEEEDLAEGYLSRFYTDVGMTNSSLRRMSKSSIDQDLLSMQAFFGLEVTGVLNNETVEVMKAPRCGVSDISRYGHFSGKPKWEKRLITYKITQYTPDLTQSQVDATIGKAFQLYSDVIPLDFKQVTSGTADILIIFKGGYHGDFYPFDGAGGVLAHANSPGRDQGGDTHFDDDETWTLTQRGVNLLLVAAHEFGHALGLDHSKDRRALMYPTYRYVNTNRYRLPDDDTRGVQALYGSRTPVPTTEPKPKPPPGPDPEPEPEDPTEDPNPDPLPNPRDEQCSRELVFDAATSMRGDLFFFKNGYYWRKSSNVRRIRLTKVSTKWPRINYVDAAFEVPYKSVVYLFEGRQYWGIRALSKTILPGYPKSLTNVGLPSSVSKVDAAVYVPSTGKILIFVNSQYWSYDESTDQMDRGYPRSITQDFPGIGSKVDAAFENYGYLYFSDGPRQSEYNLQYKTVVRVLLNYGWLNCY
ncbi:uncharacterized protein LOC115017756 [Cottoperca gobio]|uniref:Uncharacterized protein LOC115017756 n=1 Tax=Cottoperca gobio TaxID=56716 RepID=A0A6J2QYN4_COTGO|nr:uncharacterized protein LOC115017756 [Cottoperca gobio]